MNSKLEQAPKRHLRAAWLFLRSSLFGFMIWAMYTGLVQDDWLIGIPIALGFGLLTLWRHDSSLIRLRALPGFTLFFIMQSTITGLHVARLAVGPRSKLEPGWLTLTSRLPQGAARALFSNLVSLLPGTLCGDLEEDGVHHIHLLSIKHDPVPELRDLERRVGRLYGYEPTPNPSELKASKFEASESDMPDSTVFKSKTSEFEVSK